MVLSTGSTGLYPLLVEGQAAAGVAWTGMGWFDGLCVAAGRGPALDLACVCAPARGPQRVGVRVAGVWPCLPSGDCAVWSGRLGFGLARGCVIDVEWMPDVPACCARPIGGSRKRIFREVWKCSSRAGKTKPSTVHGGRFWWVSTTRVRILISKGAGSKGCPMGVHAQLNPVESAHSSPESALSSAAPRALPIDDPLAPSGEESSAH